VRVRFFELLFMHVSQASVPLLVVVGGIGSRMIGIAELLTEDCMLSACAETWWF